MNNIEKIVAEFELQQYKFYYCNPDALEGTSWGQWKLQVNAAAEALRAKLEEVVLSAENHLHEGRFAS
jgi:hypothetical protein